MEGGGTGEEGEEVDKETGREDWSGGRAGEMAVRMEISGRLIPLVTFLHLRPRHFLVRLCASFCIYTAGTPSRMSALFPDLASSHNVIHRVQL